MVSLDTETTGVDFNHGARPFFVTVCDEEGELKWWEWRVDPFTRKPQIPPEDLLDVWGEIQLVDCLVLQNPKFDARALDSIGVGPFPWERVKDTLLAGHLLASNLPHNLTDMAMQYLGVDIEPHEKRLAEACRAARRLVGRKGFIEKHGEWAVAKKGRSDMPSAKEECWKFDTWLPRELVLRLGADEVNAWMEEDCSWWETALQEYANADSGVTLPLWKAQAVEIKRRGLEAIYTERLKLLPVAYAMESRGVTISGARTNTLTTELRTESDRCGKACVDTAKSMGYDLEMPKGASPNNSLREFMFSTLQLERIPGKKSKTDAPSLDKEVLAHYTLTLPQGSKQLDFVQTVLRKRKRDSAISFAEAYRRFWVVGQGGMYILYPNLNPTGTSTLRWSSSNPNEQNISKQDAECPHCEGEGCVKCGGTGLEYRNLRYCFGPSPGREWWSLDAKNIELRLPAYESGEKELIALFEQPDAPPYYGSQHLLNFSTVYPDVWERELKKVGWDKVGPYCKKTYAATEYQWCKNGDFAIQYQAGDNTADRAFHRLGARRLLISRFDKLEALNQRWCAFANKFGYVETMPDKTVDPTKGYPLLCTRTEYGSVLPTIPLSYHVQGSAMQWTTKAMVRCYGQLEEWRKQDKFDGYIALQVHDEMVFDFPKRAHPKADAKRSNLGRIRAIKRLMEQGGDDIGVPTPVGLEYHDNNWSEGVTL